MIALLSSVLIVEKSVYFEIGSLSKSFTCMMIGGGGRALIALPPGFFENPHRPDQSDLTNRAKFARFSDDGAKDRSDLKHKWMMRLQIKESSMSWETPEFEDISLAMECASYANTEDSDLELPSDPGIEV